MNTPINLTINVDAEAFAKCITSVSRIAAHVVSAIATASATRPVDPPVSGARSQRGDLTPAEVSELELLRQIADDSSILVSSAVDGDEIARATTQERLFGCLRTWRSACPRDVIEALRARRAVR